MTAVQRLLIHPSLPWRGILSVALAVALACTATAVPAAEVTFTETDSTLRLDNGLVAVEFDWNDGAWTGLTHRSIDGSLIAREQLGPGVDFRIDETWMVETLGSVLLRQAVERDAASGAATLALTYGVGKRSPAPISTRRPRPTACPASSALRIVRRSWRWPHGSTPGPRWPTRPT
jgi:hypothetical protein